MFQGTRGLFAGSAIAALVALLTACPSAAPVGTGSLAVTITGLPAGVAAAVGVSGPGGFSETIAVSQTLNGLTPGHYDVSAAPVHEAGTTHTPTVGGSPATVTPGVVATATVAYAASGAPDPDPGPVPDAPTIERVSIRGHGSSTQLRQGAELVVLDVTGSRLEDVSIARLGDLDASVLANNPISAVIRLTIPRAASLGPRSLSLTAATGVASLADAVVITAITAGPEGSDEAGQGTPDLPFRSLSVAVGHAAAGSTVALLDGAYGEASGEAWPVVLEDVTLTGTSREGTVLEGPSAGTGLVIRGSTTVSDLTVRNFGRGLDATRGTAVTLLRVAADANAQRGFSANFLENTLREVTVGDSSFSRNGGDGFLAVSGPAGAAFHVHDSSFDGNGGRGIYAIQASALTVSGSSVAANETGIELIQDATLRLSTSTVRDSELDGILAIGASDVFLDDVVVRGSRRHGIDRGGTGRLEMRRSQVVNNQRDGVRIRNRPTVNLGDGHEPGSNLIGLLGAALVEGDFLADDRQANSVPKILAHGVQLRELEPSGSHVGPGASNTPYWRIANAGNEIDFGP
jgi:hypothetical protein